MSQLPFAPPSVRPGAAFIAIALLSAVLLSAGPAAPASGQRFSPAADQVPADSLLREFQPIGELLLEVAGKDVPGAEIYRSERAGAILVISPELPAPVLLTPGAKRVETVHLMKVAKRPDGSVDLLADAVLEPQGQFRMAEGQQVAFQVGGKQAVLKPRPPLLGRQTAAGLEAYNPEYGRLAAAYTPSQPILNQLKKVKDIEVTVYFGSWCPVCKETVPRVMRVADELAGTDIEFSYYGLPQPMSGDPVTGRLDLTGVPTGIVFRDGKEIGRVLGNSWKIPELALQRVLIGAREKGS